MRVRAVLAGLLTLVAAVFGSLPLEARTFRVAYERDVASMDPYALAENFSNAFHSNIHDTIVRYDENLQIEPSLAVSWEIVDPKTGAVYVGDDEGYFYRLEGRDSGDGKKK